MPSYTVTTTILLTCGGIFGILNASDKRGISVNEMWSSAERSTMNPFLSSRDDTVKQVARYGGQERHVIHLNPERTDCAHTSCIPLTVYHGVRSTGM